MKEIIISGYEDMKQHLLEAGFVLNDNMFSKESEQVKETMIINGQTHQTKIKVTQYIEYLGEGSLSNIDGSRPETLYGFTLSEKVGDMSVEGSSSVWVRDWADFGSLVRVR